MYRIFAATAAALLLITGFVVALPIRGEVAIGCNTTYSTAEQANISAGQFNATFDGVNPESPLCVYGDGLFAVDLHDRNNAPNVTGNIGEHTDSCGPPPDTHILPRPEDHVYYCNNHLMTAMGNPGYGGTYLTANALINFSDGATISWEQDMSRGSTRNWTDLWIQPVDDYIPLPVGPRVESVDLQGGPCNGIHVEQDHHNSGTTFDGRIFRNCELFGLDDEWQKGLENQAGWPGQNPLRRDLIVVTLDPVSQNNYRITVSMPIYGITWIDEVVEIPFSEGLVTWGQHAYTPDKACKSHLGTPCNRDTVHWDNFRFNHATPFNIISAGSHTDNTISTSVGGLLRFSSHSQNPTVNGQSISPRQSTESDSGKAKNFAVEVPAGSYTISGSKLKDVYIYELDVAPSTFVPTSTPTSTSMPTITPTPTATPTSTHTTTPSPQIIPSNRIRWQGQDWYLHGANLPWYNWGCDFGGTGCDIESTHSIIEERLAEAANAGMHTIRWWTFPGDPFQLDNISSTYADFDVALSLAEQYDLYYVFVLFSDPERMLEYTSAELSTLLAPLFERYANNPHVLSWEVVNEPEWAMDNNVVDDQEIINRVNAIVDTIHASGPQLATVGSATLQRMERWLNSNLDFYQAHWYDGFTGPLEQADEHTYSEYVTEYGLDAPLVIGEYIDGPGRLETLRANGYAGAWPWSLFHKRTNDGFSINLVEATNFQYSDNGPREGNITIAPTNSPSITPVITPTPTATPIIITPTPIRCWAAIFIGDSTEPVRGNEVPCPQ